MVSLKQGLAAIEALQQAIQREPQDAANYQALAEALRVDGQDSAANEAELAAIALAQRNALIFYNLGTLYMMTQRSTLAVKWFRLALEIDPLMVEAHQNLASVLELDGNSAEAQHHRDQAYRRQSLFIDDAPTAIRTVLILCTAGTGNTPFDFLLPQPRNRRIRWMMEYATLDQLSEMPAYDIVFNAIGDQDVVASSHDRVKRFLAMCDQPVINLPERIAHTTRDQTPALLKDIPRILVPLTARSASGQLQDSEISPPLLLRPVGSHGGRGQQLLADSAALATAEIDGATEMYVSAYYDYRSDDGYYRKYRVIFIDGQPYPYHLAISEHWQVHYVNADMLQHPWKLDEEQRFLTDPEQALGADGIKALKSVGQRMGLDYFGIDFSVMPDGRILIFEANATMLVHTESFHQQLKFKNSYVQKIIDAFDTLLVRRTSKNA
jgi:hypothetical protein